MSQFPRFSVCFIQTLLSWVPGQATGLIFLYRMDGRLQFIFPHISTPCSVVIVFDRSLSLRHRLTPFVASPPNDLLSLGHPHILQGKIRPVTCTRTHYGPICIRQTKKHGNLDLEITCLVSPKEMFFPSKEWGSLWYGLGMRRLRWDHGSKAGPFVDGEQICLQALSSTSHTERIFWDLLNFNRVWLIGAVGSNLSGCCGERSWQPLNLCSPLPPWS